MIVFKIMIVVLCGVLFSWGGYNFNKLRRFVMPIILTGALILLTHETWALTALSSVLFLCLGYGEDAPLTHVFGGCWGRGVWGLMVAISLSLGLFLTGHILWYLFVSYLIVGFFCEPLFKNLYQIMGDFLIGIGFGIIVLLVR